MLKAVSFCPVTCLPSLVIKKSGDDSQKLKDCFCFDDEVKPGWIQYDPKKITVLSCNDIFSPLGEVSEIVNVHKQMISVKNEANMKDLSNILEKPILMCVTRRHQFGSTTKTASSDSVENFLQKELTSINGFDIDFAVIFPPEVLRDKINESLKTMKRKVLKGKKFCIMIDIKRILQELTPTNLQDKDSLEYVSWHNTAFWLTNHSKPFHSLTYVNGFLFWVVLFPFSLFIALPYRLTRRLMCYDTREDLHTTLKFTAEREDMVAVHVWFLERPSPGAYKKNSKLFSVFATKVSELKPLVQDCKAVSFDLHTDDFLAY